MKDWSVSLARHGGSTDGGRACKGGRERELHYFVSSIIIYYYYTSFYQAPRATLECIHMCTLLCVPVRGKGPYHHLFYKL